LLLGCDPQSRAVPAGTVVPLSGGSATPSAVPGRIAESAPLPDWIQRIGGEANDLAMASAVDRAGDVLVTGFVGSEPSGVVAVGTSAHAFLAKLDAGGVARWYRRFAGTGPHQGSAVAIDSEGNVWMVGRLRGTLVHDGGALTSADGSFDIILMRLDGHGQVLWAKRFGGPGIDNAFSAAVDQDDALLLCGSFEAEIDLGCGVHHAESTPSTLRSMASATAFVAKLDRSGKCLSSFAFAEDSVTTCDAIAVGDTGAIVVAGITTPSWKSGTDAYIKAFGADGTPAYERFLRGPGDQTATALAIDREGNAFVTGYFRETLTGAHQPLVSAGMADAFVMKLDRRGDEGWTRSWGGAAGDVAYGIALDGRGGILLTGAAGSANGADKSDAFLWRVDAHDGDREWSRQIGGPDVQAASAVSVARSGVIYLVGHFQGAIAHGDQRTMSAGGDEAFVARFSSSSP
jgi:hypothetical protein